MSVLDQVRGLVASARETLTGTDRAEALETIASRLDEPLRVAIAGKVKAGKSTLLNALVGEELAPTDAGECTRIVTWYRQGLTYRVELVPRAGAARQVPFHRDDTGAVEVDLSGTPADEVERLVVEWPTSSLRDLTLIDTPGIDSISSDISARTHAFVAPEDEVATPADAVLYLMRHLHTTDIDFLEAFHDQEMAQPSPVNAIAVLSRADEVAVGRLDAMESATRIADRYRRDPKVRRLVQTVVPVAGLIAETGATLTEAEFQALRELAGAAEPDLESALLSADRFVQGGVGVPCTDLERQHVLDRLGIFGVRLGTRLLRTGDAVTAGELASELVRHSGLDQLREVLLTQFAGRRDVLKARSALLALEDLVRGTGGPGERIAGEVERVQAGAHEFDEIRLLNALRIGAVVARDGELEDMERLLGGRGAAVHLRLGVDPGAAPEALRSEALEQLGRWQRRAENPMSARELQDACRVLVRTCEGIVIELQDTG